jgi:hypothetical protein
MRDYGYIGHEIGYCELDTLVSGRNGLTTK